MSGDGMQNDDLLIRARRDELLQGEERRLREALTASSEMRLLFEAGRAFDAEAPVLPGDDARIERMAGAVQKDPSRTVGRLPSRRVWLALAAGMLFGVTAAAVVEGSRALLRTMTEERRDARAGYAAGKSGRVAGGSPAPEMSAWSPEVEASPRGDPPALAEAPDRVKTGAVGASSPSPSLQVSARSVGGAATPSVARVAPAASQVVAPVTSVVGTENAAPEPHAATAAELFRSANQARMQGESQSAVAAYRSLETDFPNSAEALSARLSLGMLYLNAQQASLALEQFRAYRALARGPSLGEALWGESGALRQLSRREEERRVLGELLQLFPDSVYAVAARKRLAEP